MFKLIKQVELYIFGKLTLRPVQIDKFYLILTDRSVVRPFEAPQLKIIFHFEVSSTKKASMEIKRKENLSLFHQKIKTCIFTYRLAANAFEVKSQICLLRWL